MATDSTTITILCEGGSVAATLHLLSEHFDFFSPSNDTREGMKEEWTLPFPADSVERLVHAVEGREPILHASDQDIYDFLLVKDRDSILVKYRAEKGDLEMMKLIGKAYIALDAPMLLPDGIVNEWDDEILAYLANKKLGATYWIPRSSQPSLEYWYDFYLKHHSMTEAELRDSLEHFPLFADYDKYRVDIRRRSKFFNTVATILCKRVEGEVITRLTQERAIIINGESDYLRLPWGLTTRDLCLRAQGCVRAMLEPKVVVVTKKPSKSKSSGSTRQQSRSYCQSSRTRRTCGHPDSSSSDSSSDSDGGAGCGCHHSRPSNHVYDRRRYH